MSPTSSESIPTVFEQEPQEICINDLSPQGIALLKKEDPFSYFSVPAARNAELLLKDLDVSTLTMPSDDGGNQSLCVKRQCRISTELHTYKLIEDMLQDMRNTDAAEDNEDEEDLYSFLSRRLEDLAASRMQSTDVPALTSTDVDTSSSDGTSNDEADGEAATDGNIVDSEGSYGTDASSANRKHKYE